MNTFTLTFTEQEMQILLNAVSEMPFRIAAPLVNSINGQIAAAHQRSEAAKEGHAEPKPRKVNGGAAKEGPAAP